MLRPYQNKILDQARALMRQQVRKILIRSETGSGKTHMAAEMFKGCLQRQKTADFYVHRKELIEQTANTFRKQGIPFGIIAAGLHCGDKELIQLCSVQTTVRMEPRHPFMCTVDECHHVTAKSYDGLAGEFFFGLSATPITPSGKGLGKHFTHMIEGPSIPQLQEQGYLSEYQYFAPHIPDLSAVDIVAGEYDSEQVDRIMKGKAIVGQIIDHHARHARDLLTIGFAHSISSSRAYVEAFQAAGVTAAHLDGKTPKKERRAICEAFCAKDIMVLFNVGIAEEGFDISAYSGTDVTIEALIGASPTRSLRRARQINGRVLRPKPRPAIILDHAGNFTRHGMPNDIIEWSLTGESKRITPAFSVTQCPNCFLVFRNSEICPHCGDARPIKERKVLHTEGELLEIKKSDALARKKEEERQKIIKNRERKDAKTVPQLVAFAKKYGYDHPEIWAERWMGYRDKWQDKKPRS